MKAGARQFSLLAGLILAAAPLAAAEPPSAADLATLVRAGDWAATLVAADSILTERSEDVPAWQYRAYALHRLGRAEEARAAYEQTLALDPGNGWAAMNLGDLLAAEGLYADAVKAAGLAVRLDPKSVAAQSTLSRIHRDHGAYESAARGAHAALDQGVDPAWAHAELGYLYYVLQQRESSEEHWKKAREAGAEPSAVEHGLRLLDWDKLYGGKRERAEIVHRRAGAGEEWVIPAGRLSVHTRIGPKLPRDVESFLDRVEKDHARLFGDRPDDGIPVRLHLSRTVEEHEAHRRREFPAGFSEKAFTVTRGGRGRRGWGGAPTEVDVYVAWSAPGLFVSLSHELTHVGIRLRLTGRGELPTWLDEGLAIYLERDPHRKALRSAGVVRADLLEVVAKAREAGDLLSFEEIYVAQPPAFTGERARIRYAQAWSMVHFLLEGRRQGGVARLRELLGALDVRGPPRALGPFRRLYGGDLGALEKAWERHLAGLLRD